MTPRQTIFVTIIGVGLLILVLELIRRQKMREKYALLWIFVAAFIISVPWLHSFYVSIGRLVGIKDPNSTFYFAAIVGLVLLCLQFTLAITTAYNHRKAHTHHLALLEDRVKELEKSLKAKEAPADQAGPDSGEQKG